MRTLERRRCPICGRNVKGTELESHFALQHPETTEADESCGIFITALKEDLKSDRRVMFQVHIQPQRTRKYPKPTEEQPGEHGVH